MQGSHAPTDGAAENIIHDQTADQSRADRNYQNGHDPLEVFVDWYLFKSKNYVANQDTSEKAADETGIYGIGQCTHSEAGCYSWFVSHRIGGERGHGRNGKLPQAGTN